MQRKYFYTALLAVILILGSLSSALAQSAPLRGIVLIKDADGKDKPVADAQVNVFRTDLPGKFNTKTNKKGEFAFAGLPLVGVYVIAVCAPSISPDILPNVRPGDKELPLVVGAGDGRCLTEAEAKAAAKGGKTAGSGGSGESAEDKKKREEYEKQVAEITNKNKKVEENNALINRVYKAGNDALTQADAARSISRPEAIRLYGVAVAQYNEGITADPEHPGAPSLLNNKAQALKARGVQYYNSSLSIKDNDAARSEAIANARKDLADAVAAANQAYTLYQTQTPDANPASQANFAAGKLSNLSVRSDCYYYYVTLTKGDAELTTNNLATGTKAFQEYMAAEIDPAKKSKAQLSLAAMTFEAAGAVFTLDLWNQALATYQKVLAEQPDQPDALMRCGLILFNVGLLNSNKTTYQEAANYLKLFMDKAPVGAPYDTFKKEAQEVLDNLKAQQNVKPEKVTTPAKRKP